MKFTVLHWATLGSPPRWGLPGWLVSSTLPFTRLHSGFPERVELAPLPLWQPVGEHLNLSCLVFGGAPRDHLSVVLLRREEELGRKPVGKEEPAKVTFMVQPRREDHGTNFSCRSELDLRSQGLELFQNTSAPTKLRTFGEGKNCRWWVMSGARVSVPWPREFLRMGWPGPQGFKEHMPWPLGRVASDGRLTALEFLKAVCVLERG